MKMPVATGPEGAWIGAPLAAGAGAVVWAGVPAATAGARSASVYCSMAGGGGNT